MALFTELKRILSGTSAKPPENERPDLFEYAERQNSSQAKKVDQPRRFRKAIVILIYSSAAFMGGIILACLLCRSEDSIRKKANITMTDGTVHTGLLIDFTSDIVSVKSDTLNKYKTSEVRLIELLPEDKKTSADSESETVKAPAVRDLTADEKKFLGRYNADISGHKATLFIFSTKKGYLGASLKFHSWGTGEIHYMRGVRVSGSTIYFKRQCEAELCRKLGSSHLINQDFTGEISTNGLEIKGTYLGGQNASRWAAHRF